jgi:hypothetical protein
LLLLHPSQQDAGASHQSQMSLSAMIKTVAELLDALRHRELLAIKGFKDVKHPVLIGDMYEGLTKEMLSRAVFRDLDLRVVDGLIRGAGGALTDQQDCMIVVGEGSRLPNTEHFIYDIRDVIAVVEVKKTLHSAQLRAAYENLQSLVGSAQDQLLPRQRVTKPFRLVTGVDVSSENEVDLLPRWQKAVYQNIIGNVLLPARIALGFYGFSSEYSLREGFAMFLTSQLPTQNGVPVSGYGPTSLPDLIVAGSNAIVKLNGMPYALRSDQDSWVVAGSMKDNATIALLEVIWYRLSTKFELGSSMFGEDLELEQVNPLIFARFRTMDDDRAGWEYEIVDIAKSQLVSMAAVVPWQPFVLDDLQFALVRYLCKHQTLQLDGDQVHDFCHSYDIKHYELIARALASGLIYSDTSNALRLNTDACVCAVDPDLGYVAADNHDGRFERWLVRRTDTGDADA